MLIYIVEGQTGEYSDNISWPVKAFVSEEKAKEFVEQVSAEYRKIRERCGRGWNRKKYSNPLDPNMEMDYTGTIYNYYWVELDETK